MFETGIIGGAAAGTTARGGGSEFSVRDDQRDGTNVEFSVRDTSSVF